MLKAFLSIIAAAVVAVSNAYADPLVIGAWNIADLHHEEDVCLRDFGDSQTVKRTTTDLDMLAKYRDLFGRDGAPADVIALQEIGTQAALDRLFPAEDYETLMSPRWVNDEAAPEEGDIYIAIADRKDSGVSIIAEDHLPDLAILHSDGRPTRAGTGV